jgi:hypothetical protein
VSDTPQLLLAHHLKALRLPTFLREYDKLAQQCAAEGVDHPRYLLRLAELELIERERRMVERRIKEARFPTVKSLDSFDFTAIASLNKTLVLELARCEYIARRENVIAVGNSGTGKTHIALGLGLAACQKGLSVGFITAAALVHEALRARHHHRHQQFAVRRVDRRVRIREVDRRAARPADPPRPHPRNEWRQLSPETEQTTPAPDIEPGWRSACHGAHCAEGPVLAMLALLRVAPLLPSPTLRAVAKAMPGRDGKAGSSIEPESCAPAGGASRCIITSVRRCIFSPALTRSGGQQECNTADYCR